MKTSRHLGLLVFIGLLCAGTSAFAGGAFGDPRINFRYSQTTSLKVTEPEGFKIVVTSDTGETSGTVPKIFTFADKDDYVKVTITAPDGTSWSKSIELQAKKQTELAISFKDEAKPAAAAPSRSYIGGLANRLDTCGRKFVSEIRADFLKADDGSKAKSVSVDAGSDMKNIEVPGGAYDIRVYQAVRGEWQFVSTTRHDLLKDGWHLTMECTDKQGSVVLRAK